jgi:hypothetical protein
MKFHQEKEGCSPPNFQENLQSLHLCVCVCVFVSSFPLCIVKFVDENLWLNLTIGNLCLCSRRFSGQAFVFICTGGIINYVWH